MAKKQPKKKLKKQPISEAESKKIASDIGKAIDMLIKTAEAKRAAKVSSGIVHTQCPNCNLRLVIPEVESHRCILCGCKELRKQPWDGYGQNKGILPSKD